MWINIDLYLSLFVLVYNKRNKYYENQGNNFAALKATVWSFSEIWEQNGMHSAYMQIASYITALNWFRCNIKPLDFCFKLSFDVLLNV